MSGINEVMIVAGEVSGDMHGARVLAAMKEVIPSLSAYGMGGESLQAEGMDILVNIEHMAVMGIVEVVGQIVPILKAKKTLQQKLSTARPKLLILIDYPEFNLLIAAKAKKLGIPVLFFVSPQIWAWRSYRVHKIMRLVDRMAVILPFEKAFYSTYNYEVDYVGHPLVDHMHLSMDTDTFRHKYAIAKQNHYVGLLPGSRRKEIATMLPIFLKAARLIHKEHPDTIFLIPLAPSLQLSDLQQHGLDDYDITVHVIPDDRYELMHCCDIVIAASGTVTLELALLQVPMVVSYRVSAMTYFIGSRLINVDYASLVNLIAERELVPELLQDAATPTNIMQKVLALWPGTKAHRQQKEVLAEIKDLLGRGGCSKNVAAIAKTFFV